MAWWLPLAGMAGGALLANEKRKGQEAQYEDDMQYNIDSARMKYINDFGQRNAQKPGSQLNTMLGGAMGGLGMAQALAPMFSSAPQAPGAGADAGLGLTANPGPALPSQNPADYAQPQLSLPNQWDSMGYPASNIAGPQPPPQMSAALTQQNAMLQQDQNQRMSQFLETNPWALMG